MSPPGVDVCHDVVLMLSDRLDGIGADGKMDGWVLCAGDFDEESSQGGGVSGLAVVHLLDERLDRGAQRGVALYVVGCGVLDRGAVEKVGAEIAWRDVRRGDAEGAQFGGERLGEP